MNWLRKRLIDDWHRALGLASVQIHLGAIAFLAIYEMVPAVPAEVQALIPSRYRVLIVGGYAVLGIAARLVRQGGSNAAR
jgi:hypothetical protein